MPKPVIKNIDPLKIYLHARGFHLAESTLGGMDYSSNQQMYGTIANAIMVLSALNSELFLKCLICIETGGEVPTGHYLAILFDKLSKKARQRIQQIWDEELVPFRNPMWTAIDRELGKGETIDRSLRGALEAGNRAFEQLRYSYEPGGRKSQFYIGDLPMILDRVILEIKPEWANLSRRVVELPRFDPRTGQPLAPGK